MFSICFGKIHAWFRLDIHIMFPLYWIAIAPFQFSYGIGLLFPLEQIFFRRNFRNGEGLERSDSESDTRRIG